MTENPRKSSIKFWLIFAAINVTVYIAGHFVLTETICAPPADATVFCGKAIKMWPFVLVVPAILAVTQKFKVALREINDYKAQRNKWGNWKPPQ